MKKFVIAILVLTSLGLIGCGEDNQEPTESDLSMTVDKNIVNTDGKTEDEIAQAEFERLISEPVDVSTPKPVIAVEAIDIDDIEILETTPEDLKLVE